MQRSRNILRRTALSAAAALVFGGIALTFDPAFAAQPAPAMVATATHATELRSGDAIDGMMPFTQPIHIEVSLKLRNADQLKSFIDAASRPTATQRTMTPDQFAAQHSPTAEQVQAVVDFLTQSGFNNIVVAPNRLLVSADGTADIVQTAFQTTLARVHTADGREAFANTEDAHVPAKLADTVLAVLGLQTVHQAHTMMQTNPNPDAVESITSHNPTEFSPIYSATGVATAAGVTAGIITQGRITQVVTDLNTFTSQNGLATVTTQTVNTNGTSTDTSGLDEWDLDSQDIVGMGGGQIGKIIFYNIPTLSNANLTADFNTVVTANAAKIINVSLGECETSAHSDGSAASQDQIFSQAVTQGQTFSISTGDSGADECGNGGTTPSWPAASQYVTAVAGTTLDASTTTWNSEVVWNDIGRTPVAGATGGSMSTFEPKPSWQTLFTGARRGVADVAFDASYYSGARVIVNGSSEQIGGTSLAAPIFSGLWSRVIAVKGTTVGFAPPLIYQLPAGDFHDITSGNNAGSTAGVGYDLASGRGSIILSSAITHIGGGGGGGNVPPVANFTFTTSGLTANFTDTSTDSDGTIASRSWTFGDGGTSTATNPSHTYAANGTYTVTLTVTDNGGAQNSHSAPVTVSSGGGGSSQLLGNTGFENGTNTTPWTMSSGVINNSSSEPPHAGSWDAWMDGYGRTHTDTVSQTVTIPSGKTSATLQYYLHVDTAETTSSTAYDTLKVQVTNTSGTVLATLATWSNLNHANGYVVHTSNMASYIGQTVVIKFTGTEDSSLQTSFVLDDVTLTVQ